MNRWLEPSFCCLSCLVSFYVGLNTLCALLQYNVEPPCMLMSYQVFLVVSLWLSLVENLENALWTDKVGYVNESDFCLEWPCHGLILIDHFYGCPCCVKVNIILWTKTSEMTWCFLASSPLCDLWFSFHTLPLYILSLSFTSSSFIWCALSRCIKCLIHIGIFCTCSLWDLCRWFGIIFLNNFACLFLLRQFSYWFW